MSLPAASRDFQHDEVAKTCLPENEAYPSALNSGRLTETPQPQEQLPLAGSLAGSTLHELSPAQSLVVSFLFWATLLVAILLHAGLTLSPRLLSLFRLQAEQAVLESELLARQQQAERLERLVAAMRDDPDFLERLVGSELSLAPSGVVHLPLDPALEFDARPDRSLSNSNLTRKSSPPTPPTLTFPPAQRKNTTQEINTEQTMETPPAWLTSVLESLANPGKLRSQLSLTMLSLFLIAFLFLNESFFTGHLGHGLLQLLSGIARRYRCAESSQHSSLKHANSTPSL